MSIHESKKSHILISSDIESNFERLKEELHPNRVVGFIEEGDFKIEHAKAVINETYRFWIADFELKTRAAANTNSICLLKTRVLLNYYFNGL